MRIVGLCKFALVSLVKKMAIDHPYHTIFQEPFVLNEWVMILWPHWTRLSLFVCLFFFPGNWSMQYFIIYPDIFGGTKGINSLLRGCLWCKLSCTCGGRETAIIYGIGCTSVYVRTKFVEIGRRNFMS
nr:hypothetical protein CFP56_53792 [Quercus suber]